MAQRSLVRRVGRRVPFAWPVYKALRYLSWEARALFHGLRTGPLSRLRRGGESVAAVQRPSAAAPVAPDSVVHRVAGAAPDAAPLVRAANFLADEGAGPRLRDWRAEDADAVFVLAPDEPAAAAERLDALVEAGRLRPRPGAPADGPAFTRVEIADPAAEAARLLDDDVRRRLHFGREYKLRGGRYLYQSVPVLGQGGRRDTARRWERIEGKLALAGHSVEDRLVLDVGCNAGMMLASALASGAAHGLGWDMPEIAGLGERILHGLGFTRFDLFGGSLGQDYRLGDDVPGHVAPLLDGSVVFYLAIRHHVGFVGDLAELPWTALVYEGGEEETAAQLSETLAPLRERTAFEVVAPEDYRDGEGRARPLAVLVR